MDVASRSKIAIVGPAVRRIPELLALADQGARLVFTPSWRLDESNQWHTYRLELADATARPVSTAIAVAAIRRGLVTSVMDPEAPAQTATRADAEPARPPPDVSELAALVRGMIPPAGACGRCRGSGFVIVRHPSAAGYWLENVCPDCGGRPAPGAGMIGPSSPPWR
jgi:hypothetical protein